MGRRLKFVFAFQPGPGHWSRMSAIAVVLRQRGHEVTLATSDSFRHLLDRDAYDNFLAIGPPWEEDRLEMEKTQRRTVINELRGRSSAIASYFFGAAPQVAADLTQGLQRGTKPDLLVFDYTLLGGPPAAEGLGLPWATVFGLTVPFRVAGWPPFGSHYRYTLSAALRRRYDLIEREIIQENRELYRPVQALWRMAGRRVIDPWQAYGRLGRIGIVGSLPECDFPRPAHFPTSIHYVGPLIGSGGEASGLDRQAAEFIKGQTGYPLVHVSLGMTFSWAGEILQRLIRALQDDSLRLLIASGHVDPPLGYPGDERLLIRRTLPHLEVLSTVDALICHGGAGTLMKAIYFGIPTLVIPLGAEQRSNGARLVHAGIGKMILPANLRPAAVQAAVRALLDPAQGFIQRAQEMGKKARRAGGGRLAASILEEVCKKGVNP
jgi:MGT family glycosyltransferase